MVHVKHLAYFLFETKTFFSCDVQQVKMGIKQMTPTVGGLFYF